MLDALLPHEVKRSLDIERIKKKYRINARFYDLSEGPLRQLRAIAIERLALRSGQVVLDFGCGTGLSFDLLQQAIGHRGHIIGVDLSPDMLARARSKIADYRWTNVTLIEVNVEQVDLQPESVDAVLCFYTHDIMSSSRAVERAVKALRYGGRFVAAGGKRARGWRGILINPIMFVVSLPFVTRLSETKCPWKNVETSLGPLNIEEHYIEEHLWGSAYIGYAVKRANVVSKSGV